ncbi:DUF2336 domain-containing protein [Dankookia sp. P2]|uniref:DUF2336 domain-containing protein n=1 Tax=Dankookia sp. P2 TaxID=3423955 RepID=UPI003D66EE30
MTAVARRPHLSERLSDAVVARSDNGAVAALLANDSASIREKTLDTLIAVAATHQQWQETLVRRTGLPPQATLALAAVVADHLLEPLAARTDLDPTLARVLRARVDLRLERRGGGALPPELAFEEAGLRGDRITMLRLLAEQTGVPARAVEHAAQCAAARRLSASAGRPASRRAAACRRKACSARSPPAPAYPCRRPATGR